MNTYVCVCKDVFEVSSICVCMHLNMYVWHFDVNVIHENILFHVIFALKLNLHLNER